MIPFYDRFGTMPQEVRKVNPFVPKLQKAVGVSGIWQGAGFLASKPAVAIAGDEAIDPVT